MLDVAPTQVTAPAVAATAVTPPLRRRRVRRRRPPRRHARGPRRPVHGRHGPLGLRQVHADAPARRPRHARPPGPWTIGGEDITTMSDKQLTKLRRRHIGFVFQSFNLLPTLTAEENILLPLSIAGRKADKAELEALLARVGLQDRRDHRPSELSGGQQQRVAIARALISRPTVLFADEPTGNLDSASGAEILALLREAVELDGQTIADGHPRPARRGRRRPRRVPRRRPHRRRPRRADGGRRPGRRQGGLRPMRTVALKGLIARPVRTILTTLAIVLGVAMVSGALTLTDTMRGGADGLTEAAYDGTDAVVAGKTAFDGRLRRTAPPGRPTRRRLAARARPRRPAGRRRRRRHHRRGEDHRPATASRSATARTSASASTRAPGAAEATTPFRLDDGPLGHRARRGRHRRRRPPTKRALRRRLDRARSPAHGTAADVRGRRRRPLRHREVARHRDRRRVRPAHRAGAVRQGGPLRRDPRRRPRRAPRAPTCARPSPPPSAPARRCRPRPSRTASPSTG